MKIAQDPQALLKAMQQHEMLLAELYAIFAQKFPDHQTLWKQLSAEEIRHANLIEKIFTILNTNAAGFVVERFPLPAVETSSKFVRKHIEEFSNADLPLITALSHAFHLESALIENKFFEIFQTDNPEIQQALKRLDNESQAHFKKIQKLLSEHN